MEKMTKGTPQHNGVAERMNRTLTERARCMRLKSGLPKMFWAYEINTTTFLINRSPTVTLENDIPEEKWTGKEVNLSYLRVFGCVAYVHVDSVERSKLDAKSVKCTFVGYGGHDHGYRFWDEHNRKIFRIRDVFNEHVMYKDRLSTADSDRGTPCVVDLDISNSGGSKDKNGEVASDEEPSTPLRQRSTRERRAPNRYSPSNFYLLLTDGGELESF